MIRLDDRIAIVTGAGAGLGRAHALLLAARGARVIVNDLGPAAETVAQEIEASGGTAVAAVGSVTDFEFCLRMAAEATDRWGRIDILVNNAGILRDRTFAKMDLDDFRLVMNVHVLGAANCTKAVWDGMRARNYGRVVFTTSSSGLFGNFGQSNYAAAKMALVGLMQTLGLEGARQDIRVNCLAPTAATAMMEGILSNAKLQALRPEYVSPGLLALVADDAPSRVILCAGGGSYEAARITLSRGIHLPADHNDPETVTERWSEITDFADAIELADALEQSRLELNKAGFVEANEA
jgi:NAD(P)-dependent dehydrogenase (short-subunit alcohol dehydrogenase family)